MPFNSSNIPGPLVAAYREGRCAMLVGAGASVGAGLPTWKQLLEKMIEEGERLRLVKGDRLTEYKKLVGDSSKFLMIAGGLKEDLGSNFDGFIESTFMTPMPSPTALHEAIVRANLLKFVIRPTTIYCLNWLISKAGSMYRRVHSVMLARSSEDYTGVNSLSLKLTGMQLSPATESY